MRDRNRPHAVDIAVDSLAVYRIVRLLQRDDVPPMPKIRQAADDRLARTPYHELVTCPWCLSPYVGVLVALARIASPRVWAVLAFVLASSAITGVITTAVTALEPPEVLITTDLSRWAGTEPQEP